MKPLVSIIVPMYNSERYVVRCVESLLKLQLPKEIIVVDDGSTDNSCEKLLNYAVSGEIRLLRQDNRGVSEARNLGLDNCTSSVITFVDSDDFVLTDNFQSFYNKFVISDSEMAMGSVKIEFTDSHTEIRQAHCGMIGKQWKGDDSFARLMRTCTFTPLVFCYLFKKSFIDRMQLRFHHKMSEDDLWTSIAMCEARQVLVTGELHYVYRKNADSITASNVATIFRADNHLAVANDLYNYLCTHQLCRDAQVWLCCKILYVASIAVKIYIDSGHYAFHLNLDMYKDLFSRVLRSPDEYAKKVGLMFGKRIIEAIKTVVV